MFRVKNGGQRVRTCAVSFAPIFGYLNRVSLTILDNIELTVLKVQLNKLQIQLKNDRMSLVFKKVNGKIQKENLILWVIGSDTSPKNLINKL